VIKKDDAKPNPWKGRLSRSKEFQKKHSTTWKRNQRLLFNAAGANEKGQEISYAWGLVKSLETSIYVQNPEIFVEPYDGTKMEQSKLWTSACQYDFDMMDIKSIGNIGLIDNFVCGYFAAIESLESDKDAVEDDGKVVARLNGQEYVARRIPPKDLLVDHRCIRIDLSDAMWVATRFYPTIQELKNDKEKFPNLPDDDELESFPEASQGDETGREAAKRGSSKPGKQEEKDPRFKTICVLEVLDKVSKKVKYITEHKSVVLDDDDISWPALFKIGARDMFPVTIMAFHPMPDTFYARPELDMIANQLEMLNKLDGTIYEDAVTKWRKFAVPEGFLSTDQAAKVVDTSAGNEIIEIAGDAMRELPGVFQSHEIPNLANLIVPIKDPEVKKDQLAVREMVKQEITDIIGYGPPDRGGMPKTRSAREAVAIKEKLEARLAKRSDAVADFYRLFGAKHIKFMQQTMEVERYARVFDSLKPIAKFIKYNREEISGDFNFIVYAGTSAPRNTEAKRASEIQLFQTLMPLVQAGMIPPEPLILRLAEVFQWKGVDALLKNYKPTVKQLAMLLASMQKGALPNGKKVTPEMLPNAAAATVQAVLTPEEIRTIAQAASGTANAPKAGRGDSDATGTSAGTM